MALVTVRHVMARVKLTRAERAVEAEYQMSSPASGFGEGRRILVRS